MPSTKIDMLVWQIKLLCPYHMYDYCITDWGGLGIYDVIFYAKVTFLWLWWSAQIPKYIDRSMIVTTLWCSNLLLWLLKAKMSIWNFRLFPMIWAFVLNDVGYLIRIKTALIILAIKHPCVSSEQKRQVLWRMIFDHQNANHKYILEKRKIVSKTQLAPRATIRCPL